MVLTVRMMRSNMTWIITTASVTRVGNSRMIRKIDSDHGRVEYQEGMRKIDLWIDDHCGRMGCRKRND